MDEAEQILGHHCTSQVSPWELAPTLPLGCAHISPFLYSTLAGQRGTGN